MIELEIMTGARNQFLDVTSQVRDSLHGLELDRGALILFCPHTTAGVTVNEGADPSVAADVQADLERLVPRTQGYYQHFEGNSSSHTRASVVGSTVLLLVERGQLVLGTWQSIFFCEFDGPRRRRLLLQPLTPA
jgi:secondary thiamine-phosphate synthase enzyme